MVAEDSNRRRFFETVPLGQLAEGLRDQARYVSLEPVEEVDGTAPIQSVDSHLFSLRDQTRLDEWPKKTSCEDAIRHVDESISRYNANMSELARMYGDGTFKVRVTYTLFNGARHAMELSWSTHDVRQLMRRVDVVDSYRTYEVMDYYYLPRLAYGRSFIVYGMWRIAAFHYYHEYLLPRRGENERVFLGIYNAVANLCPKHYWRLDVDAVLDELHAGGQAIDTYEDLDNDWMELILSERPSKQDKS